MIYLGFTGDGLRRDVPGGFTAAEVDLALRAGRAVATGGPMVTLELEDAAGAMAMIGERCRGTNAPYTSSAPTRATRAPQFRTSSSVNGATVAASPAVPRGSDWSNNHSTAAEGATAA